MVKRKRTYKKRLTTIFSCLTRIKSAIHSIMESISSAYNMYVDFCKETTLHGLKHTVRENFHWFERFLWFLLTLSAFAGAVYCALSQYNRYNSEPVVVSLQRDYRTWWTTFPAVTACFIDRVQPERAKDAIESLWNVTEEADPEKYEYYYNFIELVADVSFRDNLQNFWKYQSDDTVKGIDLLELALVVHPTNVFMVMISHGERPVRWHPVMTEVGMCLTFNSEYAQYQNMLHGIEWVSMKPLQCHYLSGQCFVRIDSMNNGVRYFIHSPYEISTAISNPTGEVSPGEELIIDFKAVEIQASSSVKNLRPEQRKCQYPDEWLSDSIKVYSFALCQMHCRSRMAVMFCGCRPYFHVKGVDFFCYKMATCVMRTAWRASGETSKFLSTYQKISPNVPVCLNAPNSIITRTQRRSLFVLPFGLDISLVGVSAYYLTKLKKPDPNNVLSIFGSLPGSKESETNPEKVVRCIAHRGAGLDAPENTLEAFKYCVESECNFVELDVRTCRDGRLVLLHDQGLERLAGTDITNVHCIDWDKISNIDVGVTHPNRHQFKEVHLCLLDDALDYLLANKVRMIIDVKGEDRQVVNGILQAFTTRPMLYQHAAVTTFNPFILYQIRKKDPEIVGALSYRPYCFSSQDYDAENGPNNPRYGENLVLHAALRACDVLHSAVWRWTARWCNVSAVLLHKDIVSPCEVHYWRKLGVRCAGWCVNRPLEKLFWRGVLRAPYLANTLIGEPDVEKKTQEKDTEKVSSGFNTTGPLIDKLLEPEKKMSSGNNSIE